MTQTAPELPISRTQIAHISGAPNVHRLKASIQRLTVLERCQ
jgi:hypothetical protein